MKKRRGEVLYDLSTKRHAQKVIDVTASAWLTPPVQLRTGLSTNNYRLGGTAVFKLVATTYLFIRGGRESAFVCNQTMGTSIVLT